MNLADLQLEREKLRAAAAREEFDRALEATLAHTDLAQAAGAVRAVMLEAINSLAPRLINAIAGEHDETRTHYLMSDAIHDTLTTLAHQVEAASSACPVVGERIKSGFKPRDLLTVSQWADRHRWLKSGTNAPGKWATSLTPYLREIQDSLSEHSPVRTVVFIKSSGVGGTEAMYNWLGYVMHHLQNKDLLMVVPTLELRDRSLNPRLSKMIDETPVLHDLVSTARRDKSNRGDLLEYGARARVIKAGANSPDSLRSDHLPYVICDEVDAFPWDVGGEGDPMTLIENRQRTFSRGKTYLVSTPTLEGASRIDVMYQRSDKRRYHVPCPHCTEYQTLDWGADTPHGLKFRVDRSEENAGGIAQVLEAWYVCRACGAEISEGHKTDMPTAGRWVAERPHIKATRGYHLNALYAPIGLGLNWRAVAQKWLNAQGDTAELKGFVNTYLGEVWRERGDSIENLSLITRAEAYDPRALKPAAITAGVDVQKDRVEISIVGWQAGEEAWLIDHLILPGDTARPEVWGELDAALREAGVGCAAIDSGYNTSMVYDFVRARRWAMAIKGVTGMGRPLVEDERRRRQRLRLKNKRGIPVEPLGVDQGKALIYARLKLQNPGAGYIHFPTDAAFDDEYFAQLAAEKLITKVKGGRPFQEWVQTRPRNEALDCLVYALAALRLSGATLTARPAAPAAPAAPADKSAFVTKTPRATGGFVKGWKT